MSTRKDRTRAVAKALKRVEVGDNKPLLDHPSSSGPNTNQFTEKEEAEAREARALLQGRPSGAHHKPAPTQAEPAARAEGNKEYGALMDVLYKGVDRRRLMNTKASGLSAEEAAERLERFGRNELEQKKEDVWLKLAGEFIRPMALMVWAAILIEALEAVLESATHWADVGVLTTLQLINVFLGWSEELKAADAVDALKKSLKPTATVKRDNKWTNIPAAEVVVGDRVLVASGAAVCADVILCPGKPVQIDQAALTGESLPKTMYPNDMPKMGSTCTRGEIEAIVYATGTETFFGKTASLINKASEGPGNFELLLQRITLVITSSGVLIVLMTFTFMIAENHRPILEVLAFCVVLLVASIPIAMRVVCTTTMALGSKVMAEEKAIVTRLHAVEDLAGMTVLCSDKTGTLTMNHMRLQKELPIFVEGVSKRDVLVAAALATKWREPPKDALDTLVLSAIDLKPLDMYEQLEHVPFDTSLKRTEATLRRKDGSVFRVTKGAPQVLLKMAYNHDEIQNWVEARVLDLARRGVRSLAVACSNSEEEGWVFMGLLTFLDPPRPDSAATIAQAKDIGVRTKMITGDHAAIAVEMCRALGMGTLVLGPERLPTLNPNDDISDQLGYNYGTVCETADGFAQVLPEHKFVIIEALRQRGHVVGMTGDGVNDAPALKRADVGIAVQGATDAAAAAADLVLTDEGLATIVRAIVVSRQIVQRMKNYLIYRIACTMQLLLFFFLAAVCIAPTSYHQARADSDEPPWPDFFDLPAMSVVIITILNDGTIISIAYDFVFASKSPEKWNMKALTLVSSVIGLTAMLSSLLLLHQCLCSNQSESSLEMVGVAGLEYGEIQMAIFLKISLSNFLSVFSARTTGFFWERKLGTLMLVCVFGALIASTYLAFDWPFSDGLQSINVLLISYVWCFVVVWFAAQDVLKVMTYRMVFRLGWMPRVEYIKEMDPLFLSPKEAAQQEKRTARVYNRRPVTRSRVVERLRMNQPSNLTDISTISDGHEWHSL